MSATELMSQVHEKLMVENDKWVMQWELCDQAVLKRPERNEISGVPGVVVAMTKRFVSSFPGLPDDTRLLLSLWDDDTLRGYFCWYSGEVLYTARKPFMKVTVGDGMWYDLSVALGWLGLGVKGWERPEQKVYGD